MRAALKQIPFVHTAYTALRLLRGRNARFEADYSQNSGAGSRLDVTKTVVADLPPLLREMGIRSMLDIPCGDFLWMQHVDLGDIDYIGGDVIGSLIASHQGRYGSPKRAFRQLDLVTDLLPTVDLVFCRDCLVHLSNRLAQQAIANIKRSGATYLLATTFPDQENRAILTGNWRPTNLSAAPFHFPPPLRLLSEGHPEPYADKSLGLWRVADLP
jgi:hypothetical protein